MSKSLYPLEPLFARVLTPFEQFVVNMGQDARMHGLLRVLAPTPLLLDKQTLADMEREIGWLGCRVLTAAPRRRCAGARVHDRHWLGDRKGRNVGRSSGPCRSGGSRRACQPTRRCRRGDVVLPALQDQDRCNPESGGGPGA